MLKLLALRVILHTRLQRKRGYWQPRQTAGTHVAFAGVREPKYTEELDAKNYDASPMLLH